VAYAVTVNMPALRNKAVKGARFVTSKEFVDHPIRSVSRRLVWRAHWKLWPHRPFTVTYLDRLRLTLANSTASSGIYLNDGFSDPIVARLFLRFLRPGMVAFDIGAHVGEYSVLIASRVGATGSVHSFEPDPTMIPFLRRNVRANRLDNVTVNEAAVSDVDGRASFSAEPDATSSHLSDFAAPIPSSDQTVRKDVGTLTIDSYVDQAGISAIDFVKLDIEGAEFAALKGGENTLRTLRPGLVFVECHSDALAEAVRSFLAGLEYEVDTDRGHMFPLLWAWSAPRDGGSGL